MTVALANPWLQQAGWARPGQANVGQQQLRRWPSTLVAQPCRLPVDTRGWLVARCPTRSAPGLHPHGWWRDAAQVWSPFGHHSSSSSRSGPAAGVQHRNSTAPGSSISGNSNSGSSVTTDNSTKHGGGGSEDGEQHIAEHAAQRAATRAAERVVERAAERVGERLSERLVLAAGTRAQAGGTQRLAVAGAARAERALVRGALRSRALLRMLRGLSVCLPMLGGLFCLYLAKLDARAVVVELCDGNLAAAAAFLLALACDVADVAAHVLVTLALLHQFYGVGVAVGHATLLLVEGGGLGIALLGTISAVYGELLALGSRRQHHPVLLW